MTKYDIDNDAPGFLKRLLHDQRGNTIAIMAAAVIPVIGLVGGGVDVSRIYLAQTRLQGACDAGALMGRKTMGAGTWEANNGYANIQALKMFDLNYEDGAYGTTGLTRTFTEDSGNVTGDATVTIPMALMQVLGIDQKEIAVTCQAELRIPNTDVMFVLDTTGSMGGTANGSPETKISGLKKAVKCFYETLAKKNIDDVSPADCGEATDPSTSNSGNVQLRFGFVPYNVNVNVGKLLPFDFMANQWTYQSREAVIGPTSGGNPTYGQPGDLVLVSTNVDRPRDSNWEDVGTNIIVNGTTYPASVNANKKNCGKLTPPPSGTASTTGPLEYLSQNPDPPVYPATSVQRIYERQDETSTVSYRYSYSGGGKNGSCDLQSREEDRERTTRTYERTVPVTWDQTMGFVGWNYKPVTFNVSAFKDISTNSWKGSLLFPVGNNGNDTLIRWDGCIEERKTYKLTDSDPSNDWDPIPASAYDMNIDLTPNVGDPETQWGPLLENIVWGRKSLSNGSWTLDTVYVDSGNNISMPRPTAYCPRESRLYQTWSPTTFRDYVNTLTPLGNTYHDIGLLWGARLMSPTGIFAALNAPDDVIIERHMVFMTDGGTNSNNTDYSAYGYHWFDRRQTQAGSAPSNLLLEANIDARTAALCKAIRNKNITLWVVSYGEGVDTATNTRLEACASPGKFFVATSVSALVSKFKGIAAEISALRLTQ